MRILQFNDYKQFGGAEEVRNLLSSCLRRRRHQVLDFSVAKTYRDSFAAIRRHATSIVTSKRLLPKLFTEALNRFQPDLVHVHNFSLVGADLLRYLAATRVSILFTAHDYWPISPNRNMFFETSCRNKDCIQCKRTCTGPFPHFLKPFNTVFRPASLRRVRETTEALSKFPQVVTADSEFVSQIYRRYISGPRITSTHTGIDVKQFEPTGDEAKSDYLLYAGGHSIIKGYWHAVRLAAAVYKELGIKTIFTGRQPPDLRRLNSGAIRFTGWLSRERYIKVLQAARALILPSLWNEPFATVILEAMASGVPVVAYGVGGVPEAIVNGHTGYIAEPGDLADLIEKSMILLSNPESASDMGHHSREIAKRLFTIDRMGRDYERLYESVNATSYS